MGTTSITISLLFWLVTLILVFCYQSRQSIPSIGLPFTFLFLLALQFFFGALVSILPWYSSSTIYFTQLGFSETVYGIVGFAIGIIVLTPLIAKIFPDPWLNVRLQEPDWGLPEAYIYLGLGFWFIFSPIFWYIPSLKAVVSSGSFLLLIGLCLVCWRSWILKEGKALVAWLSLMACLPLLTIFTTGYASGSTFLVFVLSFVLWFYRPRWKSVLFTFLTLFLGLSLFVTYYRDRYDIRSIVWGGQGWEATVEQFVQTTTDIEFFDPFNSQHLDKILLRMNENVLLGQAIDYISQGKLSYANGETILSGFGALVPRILWPEKPVYFGGFDLVAKYTGNTDLYQTSSNTSIAAGLVFEFYVNYGTLGVFIGFLIFGIIFGLIDMAAGARLATGNWQGFMSWYLPAIGALVSQSSVAEMLSTSAALVVLVFVLNRIKFPNFMKGKKYKFRDLKFDKY
jgi:hypothetical protein